MRLLRAVRAHAGPVLLLVATTVLSVAAFVVSTAAAGDAARRPVLVPLAALALLVAAGPSMDLARRRRTELALLRLRGARGPSLVTGVAGESVAVVLVVRRRRPRRRRRRGSAAARVLGPAGPDRCSASSVRPCS